jgi:hypothetical protein
LAEPEGQGYFEGGSEVVMTDERRGRRSGRKDEALRLLLETVLERSEVSSIAIVDERGLVVVGAGPEEEQLVLGAVAASAATGGLDATCERLTAGTDVVACPIPLREYDFFLAALGDRVSRMPEAARSVARILRAS